MKKTGPIRRDDVSPQALYMRNRMKTLIALCLMLVTSAPAQPAPNAAILLRLHMVWDREALNYFNALVSNGCIIPTTAFKVAINNYITAEKTAKNWGYQDFSYILATADSCTASINLSQPNLYQVTWVGSCTYSVANGLNGDNATCFGDTNIAQSSLTRAGQNNSHVFGCSGSTSLIFGGVAATGTFKIDASTNKTTRISSATQVTDTSGGGAGCHFGDRASSSTVVTTGKNGIVQSNAVANNSTAPGATHVGICVNNGGFCASTSKTFFVEVGQTIPNELAHYTNVRNMLVSLGAQGI